MKTTELEAVADAFFPLLKIFTWVGKKGDNYYLVINEKIVKLDNRQEAMWRFRQTIRKLVDENY